MVQKIALSDGVRLASGDGGAMKAAVFQGIHKISVLEVPCPTPSEEQVLVRVKACGVCGTDIHIYEGAKGAAVCTPPTILGHEFSGEVAAVGAAVRGWAVGDRVAVDPNNICGECHYCMRGQANFCERMIGTGTNSDGGFAEYCVVHPRQLNRLADTLSFEEGAMAEPVSCCLHGMALTDVKQGDNVLIVGGGGIGQIMLRLCVLAGAASVVVLDTNENTRELSLKGGATCLCNPNDGATERTLLEACPRKFDRVIECVGTIPSIETAMRYCGKGATLMIFGLTSPGDALSVKPFSLFENEITVKASFINPYTIGAAVNLLNSGRLVLKDLLHNFVPLDGITEVFTNPEIRRRGKVIVRP